MIKNLKKDFPQFYKSLKKKNDIENELDSVQSCSQFDVKKIIGFPFCHAAIFNNACCLASDSALI